MEMRKITMSCLFAVSLALAVPATVCAQESGITNAETSYRNQYKHAVMLFDKGMFDRARTEFDRLSLDREDVMIDGYKVLCAINMQSEGYPIEFYDYEAKYPYSILLPQIRLQYGLVLFDQRDFKNAATQLSHVDRSEVYKRQVPEYLYKRAYCDYQNGEIEKASKRFHEVDEMKSSDYSGPSRYALGYISYDNKDFAGAAKWFDAASKDPRFTEVAKYYAVDCQFMMKDYQYVVDNGPALMDKVNAPRQQHLSRILAESYLVLGNADKAKEVYDAANGSEQLETREDFFFAGSMMYAIEDWDAAIENFSKIEDRTDSIGQIANYNMAYSYIRTRNKVEAMNSFSDASKQRYDSAIEVDALFNYAKLAFDLNNDYSHFGEYMEKYPSKRSSDRIYSYIAVAALRNRDYGAAVDAFDKIDELDGNMTRNYMKSNFLRASQLIADESYTDAVPYLKASAYYAAKKTPFHQLSNYWLAESYYRSGKYQEARNLYTELYNQSALDGMSEGTLIPFNIAYCYFKEGDYSTAIKWFDTYLATEETSYRKGATLRKGDCYFMQKKYSDATAVYESVVAAYPNVNDIYPYYQSGICYGLMSKNSRKIEALTPVRKADPSAKYYPEAIYELGRAYVTAKKEDSAKECFAMLMDNPADSAYYAKAAIEMGMMCRNASNYDEALSWYKQVAEKMPLTTYADDALAAIESIYQTKNEPQTYLDYLASIGRAGLKSEAEKEQMIFNAAEQLYLSEDYGRALKALKDYMAQYPNGKQASNAYFYMAECYRGMGQKELACDCYSKVVELGSDSYSELAMLNFANISYGLQRYDNAYVAYTKLLSDARMEVNKYTAEVGMMRSAYRAHRYDEAISAAATVKADIRSESAMVREADYVTAKSYLSTSKRSEAYAIFTELAKLPKTSEGAEACYLLILDAYDRGDFDTAINKTFDFSDNSAGQQQYWLAKAFIVLGDCYAEKGELAQAKATFQSIRDGYTAKDDDILENVELRLSKL